MKDLSYRYVLRKENKKISFTFLEKEWNYKKEFGSNIIENFNITNDKLSGLLAEAERFGYMLIERPDLKDPRFWAAHCVFHRQP